MSDQKYVNDNDDNAIAYFVAGLPGFENYHMDMADASVIIETVASSAPYDQCMDNQNLNGFVIMAGPFPYLSQAQAMYPNAQLITAFDVLNEPVINAEMPKYIHAIPVSLFIIGAIVIALTHGKVKK